MCLLLPLVSTLVFSRTGSVLSHLNSLTHRILRRFPPRNCTSSSRLLRSLLSLQQRTQPAVELLSHKNSQNRESFMQRLRTSAQDTSHLILHCPDTDSLHLSLFGPSLSLNVLWSRPWGVARLLGLHGLPSCPICRKGSAKHKELQYVSCNAGAPDKNFSRQGLHSMI